MKIRVSNDAFEKQKAIQDMERQNEHLLKQILQVTNQNAMLNSTHADKQHKIEQLRRTFDCSQTQLQIANSSNTKLSSKLEDEEKKLAHLQNTIAEYKTKYQKLCKSQVEAMADIKRCDVESEQQRQRLAGLNGVIDSSEVGIDEMTHKHKLLRQKIATVNKQIDQKVAYLKQIEMKKTDIP